MNPISLISLLSTGASLLTGQSLLGTVIDGVEGLFSGDSKSQGFSDLLDSTQSSLDLTPQTAGAEGLQANGAGSILPASSGEVISDKTLEDLNGILNGKDENAGIDVLADKKDITTATDTKTEPVAIAVPTLISADSTSGVTKTGNDVLNSAGANNVQTQAQIPTNTIAQQSAIPEVKIDEKASDKTGLFKNNKTTTVANTATDTDSALEATAKDVTKVTQGKSDPAPSVFAKAERFADNTNINPNQHPAQAAFLAHDMDLKTIGDAARAARSKEDIKDKLADVDTYKIVNVSRKDNMLDLRLEPSQLGKVQIKFEFGADGKANIAVMADRPETLDLLQKDTKSIQKILTDNGINADSSSLSFNLRGGDQGQHNNFNFFSGKPLSFRVEEQVNSIASNDDIGVNNAGYLNYAAAGANGMLNIIV